MSTRRRTLDELSKEELIELIRAEEIVKWSELELQKLKYVNFLLELKSQLAKALRGDLS